MIGAGRVDDDELDGLALDRVDALQLVTVLVEELQCRSGLDADDARAGDLPELNNLPYAAEEPL